MAMTIALPGRRPVLAEALFPSALTRTGVTVVMGTALTALAAQVSLPIPGSPVPVTGQTFAVLLTAAALGPARGVASQVLYLALGAIGLPVFTQGSHGMHVILGATGGYLVGFLLAALIMGVGSRRGTDRSAPRELFALLLASAAIYVCGVTWLSVATGMSLSAAVSVGLVPFLVGDALKAALAAGLLPWAWHLVAKLKADQR